MAYLAPSRHSRSLSPVPPPTTNRSRRASHRTVDRASPHRLYSSNSSSNLSSSERSTALWSEHSSDSESPSTPTTDPLSDDAIPIARGKGHAEVDLTKTDSQHAATTLLTQDPSLLREVVQNADGETGTQLIRKFCCGGGCCFLDKSASAPAASQGTPLTLPANAAFKSLDLKLGTFDLDTELANVAPIPPVKATLTASATPTFAYHSAVRSHPPDFVQPHPPYHSYSAPVYHARELTKPGALKRTFHFDIDVTDYPEEGGDVIFKVGGAVGVCPPNHADDVDEIFDLLGVPRFVRDKPVTLETTEGRWPTIWGDDQSRQLLTTRRELLTWCSDIQSFPPTKPLLRILAEHATEPSEKQILLYLCSNQGQGAFCDLRTGPHITLLQLLHAFPSAKPPLPDLFSVLNQLSPRFYSLSNDPHVSSEREGLAGRRLIEIAVTVHETPDWAKGKRTGVGSGFLERLALEYIANEKAAAPLCLDLRVPLFRGLMANPLSREFGSSDGPMMLIGAGVGMAPFRGFILNRLRNANCASKIWLVQGVRDAHLDELYSGELGKYESQIKRVVQSRGSSKSRKALDTEHRNGSEPDLARLAIDVQKKAAARAAEANKAGDQQVESKYVQDEVRQQSDVVWDVINSTDGKIFVCGSSKGMGEGVEAALRDVAMLKGHLNAEDAQNFWDNMKTAGKYIAETW